MSASNRSAAHTLFTYTQALLERRVGAGRHDGRLLTRPMLRQRSKAEAGTICALSTLWRGGVAFRPRGGGAESVGHLVVGAPQQRLVAAALPNPCK